MSSAKAAKKKTAIKKNIVKTIKKKKPVTAKGELYASLVMQLRSLLKGEYDFVANTANFSALVFNSLPDVSWAGFYLLHDDELVLGPFKENRHACASLSARAFVVLQQSNVKP